MFNKIKDGAIVVAGIAGLVLLYSLFFGGATQGGLGAGNGSTSHWGGAVDAAGGFSVSGTSVVSSTGDIVGSIKSASTTITSLVLGSGNTAQTARSCNTATFVTSSIGIITMNNASKTDITLTGSVVGDLCAASLTSATATIWQVGCNIAQNGTATIQVVNNSSATTTIGAGTAKVCYTH